MVKHIIDMTGKRFGLLTVLGRAPDAKGTRTYIRWRCVCDCGNETVRYGASLRAAYRASKIPKNCGCLVGTQVYKHGMSATKPYSIWYDMIRRCTNTNARDFKNYGALGITVCKSWQKSFSAFWEDMHEGYEEGMWLCRKNVYKGFSKRNCFWNRGKIILERGLRD